MLAQETDPRIRALTCWSGEVEMSPLGGGMTNRNYVVTDARDQRCVLPPAH